MKRTPLPPRKTPLPRSTKPIPKGKHPNLKRKGPARRVSVVRDQKYMDWLRSINCIVCVLLDIRGIRGAGPFLQIVDPAHTVNNGRGSKGPDSSCIPLCRHHHDEMDGRLNTQIVTKAQFAEKYNLDLAALAAEHYARFKETKA